jgi:adenine deaminase
MDYISHTKSLMNVAQGIEPSDMVITGGRILNVFTGELLDGFSVSIKQNHIAYVGQDPGNGIGESTIVVEADGRTLIPGFIDGHTHIAWMFTPQEFLKHAILSGTTTIITEIFEPYPVAGNAGVLELLDSLKNQPVKIFATAPAMVSISDRTKGIHPDDLKILMERDDIIGLGESYWQGVLQDPDKYLPAYQRTLKLHKTLEGHSAGASEKKLNAYTAAGISSCHEPIMASEVLDRIRLGIYVMVREGSVRRELSEISKIKDMNIDLRRLILVSDGIAPSALLENGYMEFIVQKAIDSGFKPEDAIRMATINVAEHFRLDNQIGAIAPGRFADILILPDINRIVPETVISNGKIISKNSERTVDPRPHQFSKNSKNTVKFVSLKKADDFIIRSETKKVTRAVRVMDLVTDLVTREAVIEMTVSEGVIKADIQNDLLKIAAVDRSVKPGEMFTGFIKGFGLQSGAIAFSATWDSADIIVIGTNDEDMAEAVNSIYKFQGGAFVIESGKAIAELPLPVFGVISELPVEKIAEFTDRINNKLKLMGVPHPDPLLTIATMTTAAIPFFRICEEGYVRLKNGQTVGLFENQER